MADRWETLARYILAMSTNPMQALLQMLFQQLAHRTEGEVATYIPELGRANPDHFAIVLSTVDGHTYCVGDASAEFTIQSISKPFVYGLALEDLGVEGVLKKVDVEPSGEAFNAISLEPGTGRPRNPMINAGAIAANSLVAGMNSEDKLVRILAMMSGCAGRSLAVDIDVYQSEHATGHRNRAIGHLLRNAGILEGDVDEVVNRYFQQCSVLVNAEDLSLMAATLANGGINPRSSVQVLSDENVERVLSVMSTAGMYDYAGAWGFRIGMPAKSGVAGGVIAVLPGQLGLGIYSPRLDPYGNSVRGVAVCEALSREFALHLLRPPVNPGSVIRTGLTLMDVRSKRRRSPSSAEVLDQHGGAVRIYQLQGPIVLSTAEVALRQADALSAETSIVVFDCRRVTRFELSVARLFGLFARVRAARGQPTVFAHVRGSSPWARALNAEAAAEHEEQGLRFFSDLDLALEWCETEITRREGYQDGAGPQLTLDEHPYLTGLNADDLCLLASVGQQRFFLAGMPIVAAGDPAESFFLVMSGSVSVWIELPGDRRHRLAMLGRGTMFGEMALVEHGVRSANVDAETDVACIEIRVDKLSVRQAEAPELQLRLLQNTARDLADRLRRATAEIAALAT